MKMLKFDEKAWA
jgi:hypothetical protein